MKLRMVLVMFLLSASIVSFARTRSEIQEIGKEIGEKIRSRDDSCGKNGTTIYIHENDDTSYNISVLCRSVVLTHELDHYLGVVIDVVDTTLRREKFRVKEMRIEERDRVSWWVKIKDLRKVRKIKDPVKKSRFLRKKKLLYSLISGS